MSTNDLSAAQDAQRLAEARLAALEADLKRQALESASGLQEGNVRYATGDPRIWTEPYAGYGDSPGSYQEWASINFRSTIDTRENERYQPFYLDEDDLQRKRAEWRNIASFSSVAIGANESRKNYVLGEGFSFEVTPDGDEHTELARKAQFVVDQFCEDNEFRGILDAELFDRASVDGECFVALYPFGDWRARVRIVEPEQVTEPLDPRPIEQWKGFDGTVNYWWHGVHTQAIKIAENAWIDDIARPLGYHVVYDSLGEYWDYIPETRLEHIKRNTPRGARRGVSDFMAVLRDIELEAKLRRNTGEGAAIQAAIAFIRQHAPGTNPTSIDSFAAQNRTDYYTQNTVDGSRQVHTRKFNSGTILDIGANLQYLAGPLGSNQSPIYVEVAGYLLRAIGVRWSMPEYIISSDASNANFASTLVSESPFVKAREREQAFFARHFRRLLWKVIRIAYEAGVFTEATWPELQKWISIDVETPDVATRDRMENAQEKKILSEAKIISKRTWATEAGYDYDEEQKRLSEEPKPEPPPQSGYVQYLNRNQQPGQQPPQLQQAQQMQAGQQVAESHLVEHLPGEHEQKKDDHESRLHQAAKLIWEGYP